MFQARCSEGSETSVQATVAQHIWSGGLYKAWAAVSAAVNAAVVPGSVVSWFLHGISFEGSPYSFRQAWHPCCGPGRHAKELRLPRLAAGKLRIQVEDHSLMA